MLNTWLALPLEARLGAIAILGACLGAASNWLIYTCCYFPQPFSPWAHPHPEAPPRKWSDRLPVIGWLGLRREGAIHAEQPRLEGLSRSGRGFWMRPMLLEVAAGMAAAALYHWETEQAALYPSAMAAGALQLHWQFGFHLVLMTLLLAATMIDFDEQTVPDTVTMPGTWFAHLVAACVPAVLLPALFVTNGIPNVDRLLAVPRADWPASWNEPTGLWLAIGLFAAWCYAIAAKVCTLRHGWIKGTQYLLASLWRRNRWTGPPLMLLIGGSIISIVWALGEEPWKGLLTSLIGMAVGGGFIWCLRVVAGNTLRVEAMGFGDVTLLAMIGAFLGWQAALLTFFLAPFCAIPINLFHLIMRGENRIAFGPYLAAGAVLVVVFWAPIWSRTHMYFEYAMLMFAVMAVSLVAMGTMLAIWRPIRDRIHAPK